MPRRSLLRIIHSSTIGPKENLVLKNDVQSLTTPGLRWIDIEDPDERTLAKLQRTYRFSKTNLDDIQSPAQRPKLDVQEDYIFLVFRFPLRGRGRRARATELDVVLGADTLLTFHSADLHQLRSLQSDARLFKRRRLELFSRGPAHLLAEILDQLYQQTYGLSDEIAKQLDQLEVRVFDPRADHGKTINWIAQLRRRLIDYEKITKPQASFLQYVLSSSGKFIPQTEYSRYRALMDTAEAQWELFETSINTLNGLAQSTDSLTSHRFNQTVRLLTTISVIFLPASFVLSILSNDTPGSPLRQIAGAFVIVMAILLTVQLSFVWFLHKRRVL
ncbi:MAG: CorA family divalent cation transporter [Parcubacteria group bacterium]